MQRQYGLYVLGSYIISYDVNLDVQTYICESYHGIIFVVDGCTYDLVHNYVMGNRLIINPKDGGFKDIPFKRETFSFLPSGVEAQEIL